MENQLVTTDAVQSALMQGDLSKLTQEQKLSYYKSVCQSTGLNPLTKPFEYMRLNGKEVLYAGKNCAEQLRKIHSISIHKLEKESDADTFSVTAYARMPDGREDSSLAVVVTAGLKGEALANAKMKCETKAKRRVTLSIVGLGMLDETEVETIPNAEKIEPVINPVDKEPNIKPLPQITVKIPQNNNTPILYQVVRFANENKISSEEMGHIIKRVTNTNKKSSDLTELELKALLFYLKQKFSGGAK